MAAAGRREVASDTGPARVLPVDLSDRANVCARCSASECPQTLHADPNNNGLTKAGHAIEFVAKRSVVLFACLLGSLA